MEWEELLETERMLLVQCTTNKVMMIWPMVAVMWISWEESVDIWWEMEVFLKTCYRSTDVSQLGKIGDWIADVSDSLLENLVYWCDMCLCWYSIYDIELLNSSRKVVRDCKLRWNCWFGKY